VKLAIVTKNAIHGGVETLIALHQRLFKADVFVAGGHNFPETCPFEYTYLQDGQALAQALRTYDVVEYHWLPAWAVEAIQLADRPGLEVVHRIDTADCDKSVPTVVVAHSCYLAGFIRDVYGRDAMVIPYAIEVDKFDGSLNKGPYIGALTSYYQTKGIDIFLRAWGQLEADFPGQKVRFYGAGLDLPKYQQMVANMGLKNVELLGAINSPELHLKEYCLYLVPSRIEGMPLAILEALASNISVLCSSLPGMVEFNRLAAERGYEPPLILFESENVLDLALKLRRFLTQPLPPCNTRDYVAKFYNPDTHREAYLGAFAQAIQVHRQFGGNLYRGATLPAKGAPQFSSVEAEDLRFAAAVIRLLRASKLYPIIRFVGKCLTG
jgi:glycosyltransferase involved in cell wall biosynthesis